MHDYIFPGLLGLVLLLFARRRLGVRQRPPLPPGPPKLPLLGNLLQIPVTRASQVYDEWCRQYKSDVIHVSALGQSIVILGSHEASLELLERRSALYSSRLYLPMIFDIMDWGWGLPLQLYGDSWRTNRRLFHSVFNEEASKVFRSDQTAETRALLLRLLESPGKFQHHIQHSVARTLVSVAYGLDILPEEDPLIEIMEQGTKMVFEASVPGRFLVDVFPWLKYVPSWVPGAGFHKFGQLARELSDKARYIPFRAAKDRIDQGTGRPSFTSVALSSAGEGSEEKATEQSIIETAASMYAAGTGTIAAVISTAILAILVNPKAQRKAQAELDRVLRPGHLPSLEDRDSLPYVMALFMEVLRWNPIVPFGVPHLLDSDKDDIYQGYTIPARAIVIGNAWSTFRDARIYTDPETFDPERFLSGGKINTSILNPLDVVFGYGRRICPGRHLAISSVWLAISSILTVYNISPLPGQPVSEALFDESAIVRDPLPFECDIKPRSKAAEKLIRASSLE